MTNSGKKDYYSILNIRRGASVEDIKLAYEKILVKLDPSFDFTMLGNSEPKISHSDNPELQLATEAYKVLSNRVTREGYNKTLTNLLKPPDTEWSRPDGSAPHENIDLGEGVATITNLTRLQKQQEEKAQSNPSLPTKRIDSISTVAKNREEEGKKINLLLISFLVGLFAAIVFLLNIL